MKIGFRFVAGLCALSVMSVSLPQVVARAKHRTITAKECEDLIYKMLKADDWTKLPGFHFEGTKIHPDPPEFYVVRPTSTNPFGGSGTIDHFAVERATGDVWSLGLCVRYESPALLAAQRVLRKRIDLTDAAHQNLQRLAAFCSTGQTPNVMRMGRPNFDALRVPVKNRR